MKFRIKKVQTSDEPKYYPERLFFGIFWCSILEWYENGYKWVPKSLESANTFIRNYKLNRTPITTIIQYDDK